MVTKKVTYISDNGAEFEHQLSAEISDEIIAANAEINAAQAKKKLVLEKCKHWEHTDPVKQIDHDSVEDGSGGTCGVELITYSCKCRICHRDMTLNEDMTLQSVW